MCPAGHNTLVLRSAFPGSKSPRYSCTNSVQCFDTIVQPFALHTLTGSNKIILNRIHPVFSGLHHPTKGGTPYFPSRWSPQPIATQLPPSAPRNSPIRQQGRLSPCPATLRLLPQSTAIESQSSHSMCFFFLRRGSGVEEQSPRSPNRAIRAVTRSPVTLVRVYGARQHLHPWPLRGWKRGRAARREEPCNSRKVLLG